TITGTPSTSAERGSDSPTASAPPMSIQAELMAAGAAGVSEHPGLEPRRFGHHGLVPGRIDGELDARLAHRGDPSDPVAHVLDQDIAHATAGGGKRDLAVHGAGAILVLRDVATVHQPEIDDVDRNLGIVASQPRSSG